MRLLLLLSILTLALTSSGQNKNPFVSLAFDKVVMYDYEPKGEDPALVDKQGKLASSVSIKKQVQLDTTTTTKLNIRLGDKKSFGQVTAMCFEPHLGFVYYKHGKVVRHVLICMGCNVLQADVDIPVQHQDKQGKGNKVYYLSDGMSKAFRQFINGLMKKHNFSHQIQPGSNFDK